ncbi:lysozyme inhibitor LprI family protein [Cronobacter malonaticus]|uniref:lysozyme inhibitor LprI family protein n=1 Tax=Cronobacter malonaticus TaxID=413503 RepID=UPI00289415B4|nr:lysozyme inhibitor LprI family protein [Cronobacter malonaticus]MDT3622484.1 lysozyme inhibitor LprI family protein [Cronobacter malonaticus]
MKRIMAIIPLLMIATASLAADEKDITSDNAVDQCLDKYYEFSSECLEDLNDKTEAELKKAYETKLKSLERVDYTKWWMGDEDRKKRMIEAFRKSQRDWLTYRDGYCDVATTAAQGTHFLGAASVGCNINMNKRRIKEIQLTVVETTR